MDPHMPSVHAHAPAQGHDESMQINEAVQLGLKCLREGWHFVALAVVVALTIAVLRLAQVKPHYTASASLLVLQQGGRPMDLLSNNANSTLEMLASLDGYSNYLPTHTRIIRSPLVVEEALVSLGHTHLTTPMVIGGLSVKIPEETGKILELQYSSASRDESEQVLKAVIKSYRKFLQDNYQKNSNDLVSKIESLSNKMSRDLTELEREYLEFHRTSPTAVEDEHGRPFVAQRLERWAHLGNEAMVREFALRSELELSQQPVGGLDVSTIRDLERDKDTPAATEDSSGRLYRQLGEELAEVELQQVAATRLLDTLRSDRASPAPRVDERALAGALAHEPAVVALRAEIGRLKSRHEEAKRRSRSKSDPSVASLGRTLKAEQEKLDKLTNQLRPDLIQRLQQPVDDEGLRQAETELAALEARATALRERRAQIGREHLDRLRQEHEKLAKALGPQHERARLIGEQVARAEQSAADGPELPGAGPASALSLERKLATLGRMRERIQSRFDEDLKSAKAAEIDKIRETNLRNNLARQQTLFDSVVDQLKHAKLLGDYGNVVVQTLDPPSVMQSSVPWKTGIASALILGLVSGAGVAGCVRVMGNRFHTVAELRQVIRYPMLVDIPQFPKARAGDAIPPGRLSQLAPRSPAAEAYKLMRTRISRLARDRRLQVILISSPVANEGKSTTASNLATSLAHAGNRVLLVDADLRQPSLHTVFGLTRDFGLTDLLQTRHRVADVVQQTAEQNLNLLAAGPEIPNPAELLMTSRLREVLDEARERYDYVIVDSSPFLFVADPSILAQVADGMILVVRTTSIRRIEAQRTVEMLRSGEINVVGTVLNGVSPESHVPYGYGYNKPEPVPGTRPPRSWRPLKRKVG